MEEKKEKPKETRQKPTQTKRAETKVPMTEPPTLQTLPVFTSVLFKTSFFVRAHFKEYRGSIFQERTMSASDEKF